MTEQDPSSRDSDGSNSPLTYGLLFLAALLVLYLVVLIGRPSSQFGGSHPSAGSKLPLLELEPLVNSVDALSLEDLTGKVVLINYWGPWCPPCRKEMPHLVELQRSLDSEAEFEFVSVSCGVGLTYVDIAELRDATAAYVRYEGIEFPIYWDPAERSRAALAEVTGEELGYPVSIVLDRNQSIRGFWLGYKEGVDAELLGLVSGLLEQ